MCVLDRMLTNISFPFKQYSSEELSNLNNFTWKILAHKLTSTLQCIISYTYIHTPARIAVRYLSKKQHWAVGCCDKVRCHLRYQLSVHKEYDDVTTYTTGHFVRWKNLSNLWSAKFSLCCTNEIFIGQFKTNENLMSGIMANCLAVTQQSYTDILCICTLFTYIMHTEC